MTSRSLQFTMIAACLGCASTPAAEPEKKSEVVRLTITPATEPLPALKYQLLPKFIDRRPGNAALDYGRAMLDYREADDYRAGISDWLKLPPAEFDVAVKNDNLVQYRNPARLDLVKLGGRCNQCEWQLPYRDQKFFLISLPEVQSMRALARLTAFEARLRLSERDYVGAVETLQAGYSLGRNLGAESTLISGLAGLSITAMMDQVLLDLAQRPGAPSLYWALTFMPSPLVDPRPGLEAEMDALTLSYPAFGDTARSPEQWNQDAQRLLRDFSELFGLLSTEDQAKSGWSAVASYLAVVAKVAARSAELRAFLVQCGRSQAEVDRMGEPQLFIEYTLRKYERLRDDLYRWSMLPYVEARLGLETAEAKLRDEQSKDREIIPLGELFLPALSSFSHAFARADRRRDVLRIVEALRLHAGKHEGALPKSLSDLIDVPLPKNDPITGRPYDYVLDGGTARLTLPEENRNDKSALVYEITVAR